ncbi:hypothetical protein U1872_18370 [Sphingomonas sp. RB3P16]|uniref:DUF6894 family protein n=1 Tax=Parasphingomonas frigoris TaxID=3096163 RepID=UPI002FC7BD43
MLYGFNLIADDDLLLDDEGVELPDLEAAIALATRFARDLIAEEARDGRVPIGWSITIADDAGAVVATVPFADAVVVQ